MQVGPSTRTHGHPRYGRLTTARRRLAQPEAYVATGHPSMAEARSIRAVALRRAAGRADARAGRTPSGDTPWGSTRCPRGDTLHTHTAVFQHRLPGTAPMSDHPVTSS